MGLINCTSHRLHWIKLCGFNELCIRVIYGVTSQLCIHFHPIFNFSRERLISKTVVESEAGPAIIADAMIRGLPIILNDYIADQEAGNVPYVVKNGYGKFSKSPKEIAEIVGQWFGPKAHELKTMIGLDLNLNYHKSVTNIKY
ncbi:probable monogalactosyldiacylglycerol synthase, chloroplastic isoform X2 [Lactuca sativa]|nr:probable monogalactosyldiacylglycerol synthase, chloroplastic isoform X2 [Lactuca sativa]